MSGYIYSRKIGLVAERLLFCFALSKAGVKNEFVSFKRQIMKKKKISERDLSTEG